MFDRVELNNPHFNDCYFSYDEGLEEALYVFVDGNNFPDCCHGVKNIYVGETRFGTGLNLMVLLSVLEDAPPTTLHFYSVEKYPLSVDRIIELLGPTYAKLPAIADAVLGAWQSMYSNDLGWCDSSFVFAGTQVFLHVFIGDVSEYMQTLPHSIDAWFLDGHSPDKNPDMWCAEVMLSVAKNSHEETTLATFTAAGIVKRGLREGGFQIKRRKGFGGKRHMIQGILKKGETDVST